MSTTSSTAAAQVESDSGAAAHRAGGSIPRSLLVPLRVYLGVVFLIAAWPKLTADGGFQPRMESFLQNFALENAHGFYRVFLEQVVLTHAGLFTPLIVFGELFVGLALLTGFVTRLAAAIAIFFLLNYMFAKGMWFWTPASNDAAMLFIALVILLGAAGRSFGVDGFLHARYPGAGLW